MALQRAQIVQRFFELPHRDRITLIRFSRYSQFLQAAGVVQAGIQDVGHVRPIGLAAPDAIADVRRQRIYDVVAHLAVGQAGAV